MQTVWRFGGLAVTGELIDFADPAERGPDVRERGVRLELRSVDDDAADAGSVYASGGWTVGPGFCRFDLLESRPGAADRMHWHPAMSGGEPGERVFDPALSADPVGWLRHRLSDVAPLLAGAAVGDDPASLAAWVRAEADTIADWAAAGLRRTRGPWPAVTHDDRGMAPVP